MTGGAGKNLRELVGVFRGLERTHEFMFCHRSNRVQEHVRARDVWTFTVFFFTTCNIMTLHLGIYELSNKLWRNWEYIYPQTIQKYGFNVNGMWLIIVILLGKHSQYLPAHKVS